MMSALGRAGIGIVLLGVSLSIGAQPLAPRAGADANLARLLLEPQRCVEGATAEPGVPVTIGSVVRAVICQNALVRQGAGLSLQAQAALDLARAQRQPALSLSAGVDAERRSPTSAAVLLRLDWVLFDFGRRDAALQQARMALAAVLAEQRNDVLTALADAAQLLTAAQAAFGRLDAALLNLRTAQDSARVVEARHGAGAATLSENLQAKTALAQARLEHSRARSQWLSARGALALAIGLPAGDPIEFAPADTDDNTLIEQAVDITALMDEVRQIHPRVAAARARLAEARERANAAEGERWGSVAFSARTGRSRYGSDASVRSTAAAALEWSLPLLDRGVLDARLRDAQGLIQQRRVGVDDSVRQVELQVWQQGQALLSERDGLRESRLVLDSAETSLRVASERFRLGVGSFSDVLAAQSAAANSRFQVVEARANLRRAQLRLAAALGRFALPLGS
jgi:outer membrane protein